MCHLSVKRPKAAKPCVNLGKHNTENVFLQCGSSWKDSVFLCLGAGNSCGWRNYVSVVRLFFIVCGQLKWGMCIRFGRYYYNRYDVWINSTRWQYCSTYLDTSHWVAWAVLNTVLLFVCVHVCAKHARHMYASPLQQFPSECYRGKTGHVGEILTGEQWGTNGLQKTEVRERRYKMLWKPIKGKEG